MTDRHLVVVGGGITGLSAAWEALAHPGWRVTVVEAAARLGGKVLTTAFAGRLVDEGADAFLRRVPEALELCDELGIEGLVAPATGHAFVFVGGALRPIPGGTVLGVPLDLEELARARVVSEASIGLARAEEDHPGPPPQDDVTIGAYLRPRVGDEIVDRLIEPLVGGIYAGEVDEMSLDAATPQLAAAAHSGPSLRTGLRAAATATTGPVFAAPEGGMGVLVDALRGAITNRGGQIVTGSAVEEVRSERSSGAVLVETAGETYEADAVVIATPARVASNVLGAASSEAADLLGAVDAASVVLVTLAVDDDGSRQGSGFLVPRGEPGVRITACSWFTRKWASLARDVDRGAILRVSLGHDADPGAIELSDDEVLGTVAADLGTTMGLDVDPATARISRWRHGFPQYRVGHLDLMARVDAALDRDLPRVAVAGASCRGIGIPACVRQGRDAARRLTGDER